jgi:hypothetical protein
VAIPKGHREYAAWMRSCLYVGLKLQNGAKARRYFSAPDVIVLSLKMQSSTIKDSASSTGTDSTCEGWSPSHSDLSGEGSEGDFFLDLSA